MKRMVPLLAVLGFVLLALSVPSYAGNPPSTLTPQLFIPIILKDYGDQLSTATPTPTATATATATASSSPSATPGGQSIALDYTAAGQVNTPQFTTQSSPWRLEFTANWSGSFTVYLRPSNDQVVNQTVQAGRTYATYVYGRTGTQYLSVTNASSTTQDWTLRVIDFPGSTPTATATSTTPSPTATATATATGTATATATPQPTTVFDYSGIGTMSTPPFTAYSSPWLLEYSANWTGSFWFGLVCISGEGFGGSVSAGMTYRTYVYDCTGTKHFSISTASSTNSWTIRVIDYP